MTTPSKVILSTLEQAQSIMSRWFVPQGITAEQTLEELLPILDNKTLLQARCDLRKEL